MIKISELPAASALGGTEVVAGVQSGVTAKMLVSTIGTYVRGLFTTTPATLAEGGTGAASAGAARTALGLTANGQSLVTAANYAAMRTLLDLVIGTNVQASDATLTALAALTMTEGGLLTMTAADTPTILAKGTAGQLLHMNAGATAPEWRRAPVTLGTPAVTTSGTTVDFTGIPAGVKRVTVNFSGVSTNGTSGMIIQIGDAGGFEASGYLSSACDFNGGTAYTTGFGVQVATAATSVIHGSVTLSLLDSTAFTWVAQGVTARSEAAVCSFTAGAKSLSAELTQVRITTVAGADTFDAGAINISYE